MVPSCLHLHWMRSRVVEAKVLPCLGDLKGRWFHLSPLRDLMFHRRLGIFLHIGKHRLNFWWNHHVEDAISISEKKNRLQLPNPEGGQTLSPIIPQRSEIIRLPPALDASCHPTCSSFSRKKRGEFANLWQFESIWKLRAQTSARAPRPQATLRCLGEQPEPCRVARPLSKSLFCVGSSVPFKIFRIHSAVSILLLVPSRTLLFHVYFLNRNPPCASTDEKTHARHRCLHPVRRSSTADASALAPPCQVKSNQTSRDCTWIQLYQ